MDLFVILMLSKCSLVKCEHFSREHKKYATKGFHIGQWHEQTGKSASGSYLLYIYMQNRSISCCQANSIEVCISIWLKQACHHENLLINSDLCCCCCCRRIFCIFICILAMAAAQTYQSREVPYNY